MACWEKYSLDIWGLRGKGMREEEFPGMPDCHAFVSYFQVFQMSSILHVFGLLL